jgi:hypothetical protein
VWVVAVEEDVWRMARSVGQLKVRANVRVLTVRIPVAEHAVPRKVEIASNNAIRQLEAFRRRPTPSYRLTAWPAESA